MLIHNFKQFNLKTFQNNLKKGWNTADFSKFFGLSEEDLYTQMCEILNSKNADKLRRRMRKNPGVNVLHGIKSSDITTSITSEAENRLEVINNISNTEFGMPMAEVLESLVPEYSAPIEEPNSSSSAKIEALESKKAELTKALSDIEESLSISEETLHSIEEEGKEIQEALHRFSNRIEELKALEKEHKALISRKNEERVSLEAELHELETELKALEIPKIFIEADGTIEVESTKPVLFEGWEKYFEELLKNEASEDFTIKQLKAVAKLKTFMKESECEYIIGDDNLNAFFDII